MGQSASCDSPPPPTRSQRQDELVNRFPPGTAKVDRRPNTNPDGSEIQTISEFNFPLPFCESWVKDLYKHIDNYEQADFYLKILRNSCGIDVKLRKLRNELKEKGSVQLREQKNQE